MHVVAHEATPGLVRGPPQFLEAPRVGLTEPAKDLIAADADLGQVSRQDPPQCVASAHVHSAQSQGRDRDPFMGTTTAGPRKRPGSRWTVGTPAIRGRPHGRRGRDQPIACRRRSYSCPARVGRRSAPRARRRAPGQVALARCRGARHDQLTLVLRTPGHGARPRRRRAGGDADQDAFFRPGPRAVCKASSLSP